MVVEDHALAVAVDDDGRDRTAVSAQALHARSVHPLALKMLCKDVGGGIVPHWATKSHVGTQTGQGHSGIGRHPAHTLVVLVGWGFGGECGEGLNAKHHVQSDMAHSHQSRIHESTLSTR
jgi:hypothetical protein